MGEVEMHTEEQYFLIFPPKKTLSVMHTHQACDMKNSVSLKKKTQFLFESFLNQVKAPPPTSHSRKDGKTNDYNRLFAFFLSPEEHKGQGR